MTGPEYTPETLRAAIAQVAEYLYSLKENSGGVLGPLYAHAAAWAAREAQLAALEAAVDYEGETICECGHTSHHSDGCWECECAISEDGVQLAGLEKRLAEARKGGDDA